MSGWEELRAEIEALHDDPIRFGSAKTASQNTARAALAIVDRHRATLSGSTAPLDVELMTRAMERAMAAVDDEWTIPEFADLTVAEYARLSALEAAT